MTICIIIREQTHPQSFLNHPSDFDIEQNCSANLPDSGGNAKISPSHTAATFSNIRLRRRTAPTCTIATILAFRQSYRKAYLQFRRNHGRHRIRTFWIPSRNQWIQLTPMIRTLRKPPSSRREEHSESFPTEALISTSMFCLLSDPL